MSSLKIFFSKGSFLKTFLYIEWEIRVRNGKGKHRRVLHVRLYLVTLPFVLVSALNGPLMRDSEKANRDNFSRPVSEIDGTEEITFRIEDTPSDKRRRLFSVAGVSACAVHGKTRP